MLHRASILLAVLLTPALASAQLRVVMIDVGQGDSIAVVTPSGCAALFDGGPTGTGARIKSTLASLGVTHLDFAVASHYHADHIGGLDEVEQGTDAISIGAVYDRGSSYGTTTYSQYATQFSGRRHTVSVGQSIPLCEVSFVVEAVNANGLSTTDENALSVVMKMSFGQFDALLGGDLQYSPTDVEGAIASHVGPVELYKVHHHGSSTSSSAAFLAATVPVVSLISVGYDNTYGHPADVTVARLQAAGTDIWQTEDPDTRSVLGDIVVATTDGASFTVTQNGTSASYASYGGSGGGGDLTPPTAPSSLTATAASTSQVDLAWTAATDDVGVASYTVYRSLDGASFSAVASTDGTSFADTGLAASTTYWYRVTAFDAAGNESPASNVASATTPAVAVAKVIVNEILANEPGSDTGGEFVEIVNVGNASIGIGGWTLSDKQAVRHVFASGTTLGAGQALVVFGSASSIPAGVTNAVAASTGTLALANTGDTVRLKNGGSTVDSYSYKSALAAVDGVSMNRSPDGTAGATFVLHTSISASKSSPGVRADGTPW